jgi:hypothetical protein
MRIGRIGAPVAKAWATSRLPGFVLSAVGPFVIGLAAIWLAATAGDARAATARFRCTNPASGTSWEIVVDHERSLVDALPAQITERWISWFDPSDRGYFDLERATGDLQVRHASSTGGYFLFDKCRPL